jgi:hypothetical protein
VLTGDLDGFIVVFTVDEDLVPAEELGSVDGRVVTVSNPRLDDEGVSFSELDFGASTQTS